MAAIHFSLTHDLDATPAATWAELIDWKGHEAWVVSTSVDMHNATEIPRVGDEFTAWTGPLPATKIGRRLSLEDRMRVDELDFDEASASGSCSVTKLGPVLTGTASFTVAPNGTGTRVEWIEDVQVRFAPNFVSPLLARIGVAGFRFSLGRLAKQLRAQSQPR